MRYCQNKTGFSWSYRDSSKRPLENDVISRRGKRKIHTLEIGRHVLMAKSDPEAQRKSSLSDCTWLKFLMHFREPGSSLYFYFYYFFSFSHIYIYIFSFFLLNFFICTPLNSKITSYLPPPPCLDVARPWAKR
jgi:hypothetical protein